MDRPNETASSSAESSTSSSPAVPIVKVILPTTVTPVDRPRNTCKHSNVKMEKQLCEIFSGDVVTEAMLSEAAKPFSENCGAWGEHSQNPGKPVKLGARRLREQYLPDPATYVGNYHESGFASGLLKALRSEADDIYGIMSSHPVACLAAASSFERLGCGVDTGSFVDHEQPRATTSNHEQPQEALEIVRQTWQWQLGDLLNGHEYLLILPSYKHHRSRYHSSVKPESEDVSSC
ncbi:hypothetical protein EMCG_02753 [[Emmonsia] crescens]|uniref:Uncharacterized protein n=1 Tax=[Emmonsia] crescens TaxID=73230 RepID=A0A0G2HXU9_9EURO|nr:hypothetical protein EMCG_02753 [Emmonsia crescens UAMH 3008]